MRTENSPGKIFLSDMDEEHESGLDASERTGGLMRFENQPIAGCFAANDRCTV